MSTPTNPRFERREEERAAAEAALVGGLPGGSTQPGEGEQEPDPADRPVLEAGGGEAEGFEQAESALVEHASHGDQQSAHAILHDQGPPEEPLAERENGEADHEHTSERLDDERG